MPGVVVRFGHRLQLRVDEVLERPALPRPGLLGLRHPLLPLLLLQKPAQVLAQTGDLTAKGAGLARMSLPQAGHLLAVSLLRLEDRLSHPRLHGDERIRAVLGREKLEQPDPLLLGGLGHDRLDLLLNGATPVLPEALGDLLRQARAAVLERCLQPPVELAQAALELSLDQVDVGGDRLAVDDARADLDRLPDRLGGRSLLRGLVADDARRQLVDDLEPLDDETVLEGPDDRAGSIAGVEW